jgi:3-oxoacid CoA-transferase
MGGAMDLISNPDETKIVVATDHVDKHRNPKIVEQCSLPLTGARCVSTIITDLVSEQVYKRRNCSSHSRLPANLGASKQCVFQVDRAKGGLELTELAPGVSVEEVKKKTGAKFSVAENLKVMEA